MPRKVAQRFVGLISLLSGLLSVVLLLLGFSQALGPAVILFLTSLAVYCRSHKLLRRFAFTVWVFAFVAASLFYPSAFGTWFGFDLKNLIVPLIQVIMFGMGTTLSVKDFTRVFALPWPVFIGFILQFSVMPLVGFGLALMFDFDPEVAAGLILVGSCPGGVASNLMTYLAGGNVALSVTMTSCSTLLSPVITPFLMETLAGRLVPVDFVAMMLSILNMIIVPVAAGLVSNRILYSSRRWANRGKTLAIVSAGGIFLAVFITLQQGGLLGPLEMLKNGLAIGFALSGTMATAKLMVSLLLRRRDNWMDKALPVVSMAGICFIIAIITARSRNELLAVGLVLLGAVVLHNAIGYFLGYWGARAAGLDGVLSRTVAFEVGMQNGGMASGIALEVLKSASAALAPAIFGPWMNISGSVLANWWRRKPVKQEKNLVSSLPGP